LFTLVAVAVETQLVQDTTEEQAGLEEEGLVLELALLRLLEA
jgi:hypothetical protein